MARGGGFANPAQRPEGVEVEGLGRRWGGARGGGEGGDEGQGGEQAGRHGVQGVLLCRDLVLL